jgi:hypothetical protein
MTAQATSIVPGRTTVTTSQPIHATSQHTTHGAAATIAVAIVAGTAVAGLFLAAITFGALAIAFPIAAPVAQEFHVAVRQSDIQIAQQFAAMWWVFGGLAIVCLAAASAIVLKTVTHFGPKPMA